MRIILPAPRLLPLTMAAMAALLMVKSVALVRAAVPAEAAQTAAGSPAPAPAAGASRPDPLHPDPTHDPVRPAPAQTGPAQAAPAQAAAPPAEPPVSESERALLLDLRSRRTELETQAAALAAREAALAAAEHRLAGRVGELTDMQQRLEALENDRKAHDEANWRGLVKMYETMKPRDAAAIFNDLDLPVLLPVLDRMKETKAASVLAVMQPERARQVTAELAQLRTRAITPARPAAPPEEKR